jgi:hypothetical protein
VEIGTFWARKARRLGRASSGPLGEQVSARRRELHIRAGLVLQRPTLIDGELQPGAVLSGRAAFLKQELFVDLLNVDASVLYRLDCVGDFQELAGSANGLSAVSFIRLFHSGRRKRCFFEAAIALSMACCAALRRQIPRDSVELLRLKSPVAQFQHGTNTSDKLIAKPAQSLRPMSSSSIVLDEHRHPEVSSMQLSIRAAIANTKRLGWHDPHVRDGIVLFFLASVSFAFAHFYDLPPHLLQFGLDNADWEADDLIFVVFMLSAAFMIYGFRRYRDLAREIKARIDAEGKALELARHDPLTGLPNRRFFEERLNECLLATSVTSQLAVLMLDLDGFKPVNDSHGHAVGDKALIEFASKVSVSSDRMHF